MEAVLVFLAVVILAVVLILWASWKEYLRHRNPDHQIWSQQPGRRRNDIPGPGYVPPPTGRWADGWHLDSQPKLPPFVPPSSAPPEPKRWHTHSFGDRCESSPDFPNLFTRRCVRCGEEVLFDLNDM
jgi:hypothetical protein